MFLLSGPDDEETLLLDRPIEHEGRGAWVQGQRYTVHTPPLVPSLTPPAVIGLTLLLFGIAAAGLRGRFGPRS